MPDDKGKPEHRPVSHHSEKHVVVEIPHGSTLEQIEKQIHAALHEKLVEEGQDFLVKNKSKELIIALQHIGK
jgi:hypothetical protein